MEQKKLSEQEVLNLTAEKAWEVVEDFLAFIASDKRRPINFFSELAWDKSSILVALIELIRLNRNDSSALELLFQHLILLEGFIPDPDEYQKLISGKEIVETLLEKEGLL